MSKKLFPAVTCLIAACGMFTTSCSDQTLEPEQEALSSDQPDTNFIPLAEALQNADIKFKTISDKKTRSASDVESVEIKGRLTRSSDDGLYGYYLVNYEDNGGFALLSADRRRRPVMAYSDSGTLHFSDTLENKGLSWYMNDALAEMDYGITLPPKLEMDTTMQDKPWVNQSGKWDYCEPLLKGMAKFHQESPYNKYCFTTSGEQAITGCVALAIGTVMGYEKWPNSYKGYIFDWTAMYSNFYHDCWARLFEVLGRSENLNAIYGDSATGAYMSNVDRTFYNIGYTRGELKSFSITDVASELNAKHPVICAGNSITGGSGHAWVIDAGYFTWTNQMMSTGGELYYEYFYHCVWGGKGLGDGYFLLENGQFKGNPIDADLAPYVYRVSGYSGLEIYCGMRPNK